MSCRNQRTLVSKKEKKYITRFYIFILHPLPICQMQEAQLLLECVKFKTNIACSEAFFWVNYWLQCLEYHYIVLTSKYKSRIVIKCSLTCFLIMTGFGMSSVWNKYAKAQRRIHVHAKIIIWFIETFTKNVLLDIICSVNYHLQRKVATL